MSQDPLLDDLKTLSKPEPPAPLDWRTRARLDQPGLRGAGWLLGLLLLLGCGVYLLDLLISTSRLFSH